MKYVAAPAVVIVLLLGAFSKPLSSQDRGSLAGGFSGQWAGQWSNPAGFEYDAEMRIQASSNETVQGEIHWRLKKSPRKEEQSKIGRTGVEFVRGSYDAAKWLLSFQGYSETDPDSILGLDKYRLILAENFQALGGITWNNGDWRGRFFLTKLGKK